MLKKPSRVRGDELADKLREITERYENEVANAKERLEASVEACIGAQRAPQTSHLYSGLGTIGSGTFTCSSDDWVWTTKSLKKRASKSRKKSKRSKKK